MNRFFRMLALTAAAACISPSLAAAQSTATVLKAEAVHALVPASVFYRGQTATTELRNSGGIHFTDGYYVLGSLVDTGGYSTGIASRYQAWLATEVPIVMGGKPLAAGTYGIGFLDDGTMVVNDIGAHELLHAPTSNDDQMHHPLPLQFVAEGTGFRLYIGRRWVSLQR